MRIPKERRREGKSSANVGGMAPLHPTLAVVIARGAPRLLRLASSCISLSDVDVADGQTDRRSVGRSQGTNASERRDDLALYPELCRGPGMTVGEPDEG